MCPGRLLSDRGCRFTRYTSMAGRGFHTHSNLPVVLVSLLALDRGWSLGPKWGGDLPLVPTQTLSVHYLLGVLLHTVSTV